MFKMLPNKAWSSPNCLGCAKTVFFSEVPHRPPRMRLWYSGPDKGRKIRNIIKTQRINFYLRKLVEEQSFFLTRNLVLNSSYTSSKSPWSLGKFERSTRGQWGSSSCSPPPDLPYLLNALLTQYFLHIKDKKNIFSI